MTRNENFRRFPLLVAVAAMLSFAACKPCELAETTQAVVQHTIKPVMLVLGAVLPEAVTDRYNVLVATYDATAAALEAACKGKDGDTNAKLLAATNAAVELLEWYKAHRPDQALAVRALTARNLPVPRAMDSPEVILAKAGGGKPKAVDLDALLEELKAARDKASR